MDKEDSSTVVARPDGPKSNRSGFVESDCDITTATIARAKNMAFFNQDCYVSALARVISNGNASIVVCAFVRKIQVQRVVAGYHGAPRLLASHLVDIREVIPCVGKAWNREAEQRCCDDGGKHAVGKKR